jgi:hypothetical protein
MVIKYDKTGHILSCHADEIMVKGKNTLRVSDKTLPEDFLTMFALGKYFVRKGKIVENKKYRPPEAIKIPSLQFFDKPVRKDKRGDKIRKSKKKRQD